METEIKTLTARLLAHRVVPRGDALAKKALLDDSFRLELDKSLAAVGLRLVENPYAEHIAVALLPEMTEPVFGSGDAWLNNNLGLPRDGVALLVILWALIILPKRERQIARVEAGKENQSDMFGAQSRWKPAKPCPPACPRTRSTPTSARRWAVAPVSTPTSAAWSISASSSAAAAGWTRGRCWI